MTKNDWAISVLQYFVGVFGGVIPAMLALTLFTDFAFLAWVLILTCIAPTLPGALADILKSPVEKQPSDNKAEPLLRRYSVETGMFVGFVVTFSFAGRWLEIF